MIPTTNVPIEWKTVLALPEDGMVDPIELLLRGTDLPYCNVRRLVWFLTEAAEAGDVNFDDPDHVEIILAATTSHLNAFPVVTPAIAQARLKYTATRLKELRPSRRSSSAVDLDLIWKALGIDLAGSTKRHVYRFLGDPGTPRWEIPVVQVLDLVHALTPSEDSSEEFQVSHLSQYHIGRAGLPDGLLEAVRAPSSPETADFTVDVFNESVHTPRYLAVALAERMLTMASPYDLLDLCAKYNLYYGLRPETLATLVELPETSIQPLLVQTCGCIERNLEELKKQQA